MRRGIVPALFVGENTSETPYAQFVQTGEGGAGNMGQTLYRFAEQLEKGSFQPGDSLPFDASAAFERQLGYWLNVQTKRTVGRLGFEQCWLGLCSLWVLHGGNNPRKMPENGVE